MDPEELDYSDEEVKGDINTEDENELLGITESEATKDGNDFLDIDCPEDYQEDETGSTKTVKTDQIILTSTEGTVQQAENESSNSNARPSRRDSQSSQKGNFNNRKFNKNKRKNNFPRKKRSRSGSFPRIQNRDFNPRFNSRQPQIGNNQYDDRPQFIIASDNPNPEIFQAVFPVRNPTIFPSNAITQEALHQQRLPPNLVQVQQRNTQPTSLLGPYEGSGGNFPRHQIPGNQFPSNVNSRGGFNNLKNNNQQNRGSMRPLSGNSGLSFNNNLGGTLNPPYGPPPLRDANLPRKGTGFIEQSCVSNQVPFNNPNFPRRNAAFNQPKPLMSLREPQNSYQNYGDYERERRFENQPPNNPSGNFRNSGHSNQGFRDFQVTRPNPDYAEEKLTALEWSRFKTRSEPQNQEREMPRNDYNRPPAIHQNQNTSHNRNLPQFQNNSHQFRKNSKNQNFHNRPRSANNSRHSSRENLHEDMEVDYEAVLANQNAEGAERQNDDFNRGNNFNTNKFSPRKHSPKSQNKQEEQIEEKPPVTIVIPEITPEDKELVAQKKLERAQRFANQPLVEYEVSSHSSAEGWTIDDGSASVSVANSISTNLDLEIDENYLKGMAEQKRKQQEVMKNKMLKRKSGDSSLKSETTFDTDAKPKKKINFGQKESLMQRKNPFQATVIKVEKDEEVQMEVEENSRQNWPSSTGPSPSKFFGSTNLAGNNRPTVSTVPPRTRSKSPFPMENRTVRPGFGDGQRSTSPHPARSKTPPVIIVQVNTEEPPRPTRSATPGHVQQVPRPKSPFPTSTTKFDLPDDFSIQKTIFNDRALLYARSYQGSGCASTHSSFSEPREPDSVFMGSIVKILNLPSNFTISDLENMCSTFGKFKETKLNFPKENSACVRFEQSTSADAFFETYHRKMIGGNFIDVIVI